MASPTVDINRSPKIGIIGAGISGIAAAKQLAAHSPVVFEATDSIGGVWRHCSFASTKLQTPRTSYQFSDFPWPPTVKSSTPTHLQVLDYLRDYAVHFDLLKFVQCNSRVVHIRYVGHRRCPISSGDYGGLMAAPPVWEVAVQVNQSQSLQWYGFELVVVCAGKFGDVARSMSFPRNKGDQVFEGKVMHSMDYAKLGKEEAHRLLCGKKVAIVGYRKSAIDLALECALANQGPDGQTCTMVIRSLHWTVPSYKIWGLPFFLFYSTRSSQFLHDQPNQSLFRAFLCSLYSPLMRRIISKFIESYLVWKSPLVKYGLKPEHSFEEDFASCQMATVPEKFFSEADKGKIVFKKTPKWCFWRKGLEFDDNTRLEADVVILATGFDGDKKLQLLLPQPFSSLVVNSDGIIPLYRGTIHPLIPNMAFVGYVETVSNLQAAELRCIWLARLVDNMFNLPTVEVMLEQISKELEVMKKTTRFYKKQCFSTFSINHNDEICQEMGWNSWRKGNWFSEAFSPYISQDYMLRK